MASATKAPPQLWTGRGLPASTKHPTDGDCYRRSSGRPRSYRCLEIADEPHGGFVEVAPGLGQAQAAGGAHKKLRAEMFFERRNLFADHRLPCSKLASDRRKAPASRTS
jgi:hypothetical protein